MRYIPENTYSINDHEETLKNETVEPKDSEESDRSEITVSKEFTLGDFWFCFFININITLTISHLVLIP